MGDLLIGTRRPRSQSALRAAAIVAALAVVGSLVALLLFRRVTAYAEPGVAIASEPLTATPEGALRVGSASLTRSGGLRVLRLAGGVAALGTGHGRLLGDRATAIGRTLAPTIAQSLPAAGWLARRFRGTRLRWAYRLLDDGVPGHQLVELAALAAGIAATRDDGPSYASLLQAQAALDVGARDAAADVQATRAVARSLSVVSASRSASGDRLLIGRSFALPGAADGGDAAADAVTLTLAHPEGALAYASVGWPGLVGVVTGVNREGIAILVHPAETADTAIATAAQPMALVARDVLENAHTLDDAIAILERAVPLGAAAFVVVDGGARSWAVVERSASRSAVRRQPSNPVVGDVLQAQEFAEDPVNDRAKRAIAAVPRAERARERLLQSPVTQPADIAAVLRDRRAAGGGGMPLGHPAAVDDLGAVHAAVIDPSSLVLWVSEGPGPQARFRAFDLRYELLGEGVRPAPPPDIDAEAGFDAALIALTREARGELRAARRAATRDEPDSADEHLQRALALAPSLPEAHRLAGDLARARGDGDTMRRHYRQYLELSPEDRSAAEELRALIHGL